MHTQGSNSCSTGTRTIAIPKKFDSSSQPVTVSRSFLFTSEQQSHYGEGIRSEWSKAKREKKKEEIDGDRDGPKERTTLLHGPRPASISCHCACAHACKLFLSSRRFKIRLFPPRVFKPMIWTIGVHFSDRQESRVTCNRLRWTTLGPTTIKSKSNRQTFPPCPRLR